MGPDASDAGSDVSDSSSNPGMDPHPRIDWYMCRPEVSDVVELAGGYDDPPIMVHYSTTGWVSRRISHGPIKGCIQAPPAAHESLGLGRGEPADGGGLFYFCWPDVSDPKWIVELAGFHNNTPMSFYEKTGWIRRRISNGPIKGCIQPTRTGTHRPESE